jgi:hypothetical protein
MIHHRSIALVGVLAFAFSGCSSTAVGRDTGATTKGDGGVTPETCPQNTGYPGDANCIAAPAAGKGFQLHYGPADHDDPVDVAKYLVQPGEEAVNCYALKTGNDTDVYSTGYQFHMRPGSHHLIAETQDKHVPTGPLSCGAVVVSPGGLGGTQLQIDDSAKEVAPENEGLAIKIAANTQAVLNFHVVNSTDAPLLSEAWLNYDYADESTVTGMRGAVFLVGGLGFRIDPGTKKTYQYSCSPTKPSRILQLAAHMHVHASRMTAWKVSGGVRTKILESFNWEEPGTVYFDSAHQNPTSDATAKRTGADVSGDLTVDPTESIQWECEVENTSNAVLAFRNEVVTGEMCVVTGAQVRADDPTKSSDFACVRN